jgi:hypothetical protein
VLRRLSSRTADFSQWRKLGETKHQTVTVEAEGYEPKSESLKLPEGAVKELVVRLKKKA